MEFNRKNVFAWMRKNASEFKDPLTNEVDSTSLAEAAATEFNQRQLHGPLDDETHWLWEEAAKF